MSVVCGIAARPSSAWRVTLLGLALGLVAVGCRSGADADARLYVTSGLTDEVVRVDPGSGMILEHIAVDPRPGELDEPHGIAVAPTRDFWYATVAHGEPTLWKFELRTDRLVGRVRLGMGGAGRIGITPDGRRAFVPDYFRSGGGEPGVVAVIALGDLTIDRHVTLCPGPHDAEVEPGGGRVAITCSLSDEIVILDTETAEVVNRFFVDSAPGVPGNPRFQPLNLVWGHTGDTVFVTLHAAGLVRGFAANGASVGAARVGKGPAQIAFTPNGRTLVVPNRGEGSLSLLRVPDLAETARVELGVAHPHGVAVATDGRRAFVTFEGNVETPGGLWPWTWIGGRSCGNPTWVRTLWVLRTWPPCPTVGDPIDRRRVSGLDRYG